MTTYLGWIITVVLLLLTWQLRWAIRKIDKMREAYLNSLADNAKAAREEVLREVEERVQKQGVTYRVAVRAIRKECAHCGKSCLHCAKKKRVVKNRDSTTKREVFFSEAEKVMDVHLEMIDDLMGVESIAVGPGRKELRKKSK